MAQVGVSVVTTTWNERENIEALVKAIHRALGGYVHEIIVVDDSSSDDTLEVAQRFADVAVSKKREGQSKGLLYGMKFAKHPVVVTIDADLENDPAYIPELLKKMQDFEVVVASRTKIPRFSERLASKTLGRVFGVKDCFSNFRAFRRELAGELVFKGGETFGGEFLVIAKKRGLRIGEIMYVPPARRAKPRIGGSLRANLRILWATVKCWIVYFYR